MSRITRQDIGKCRDCKWWESLFDTNKEDDEGYCEADKNSLMICHDCSGNLFNTNANFGCIHWEGKD